MPDIYASFKGSDWHELLLRALVLLAPFYGMKLETNRKYAISSIVFDRAGGYDVC